MTSHWPLAPSYGAQQRVLNIGTLLSRIGDVSYVIVEFGATDEETVRRTKSEFDVRGIIRARPTARGNFFGRLRHRILHELDGSYLKTLPLAVTEFDRKLLLELVQQHDVTWIHRIEVANLLEINKWPHSVLDVDDLPSRFHLSSAQSGVVWQGRYSTGECPGSGDGASGSSQSVLMLWRSAVRTTGGTWAIKRRFISSPMASVPRRRDVAFPLTCQGLVSSANAGINRTKNRLSGLSAMCGLLSSSNSRALSFDWLVAAATVN